MPFSNLDNNWSNLAQYYNKSFVNRPSIPTKAEQFLPFDDGFIRGGLTNATLASVKDVIRIGKFITGLSNISKITDIKDTTLQTATKGILFLAKQVGLQRANPRLEYKNQGTRLLPPLFGGVTRIFTGAGILESVGGNAFGLHLDRAGLSGIIRDEQKYGGDIDSPRSGVAYYNNFGEGNNNTSVKSSAHNRLLRYAGKRSKEKTDNLVLLDHYSGGANKIPYGLGSTNIYTYTDRTSIRTSDLAIDQVKLKLNGFFTLEEKIITKGSTTKFKPRQKSTKLINSLGKETINLASNVKITITTPDLVEKESSTFISTEQLASTVRANVGTSDYPTSPLETILRNSPRYYNKKIGNGGNLKVISSSLDIETRIGVSGIKRVDSINTIDITNSVTFYENYAGGKTQNVAVGDKSILGKYGRDIIKFRIEFLNNDSPIVDKDINADVLAFRAYLDDFNDGMNAKWNSYRYMGRGEDFYVYEGFTRDIGLSFTMFAHTQDEMKPLYKKLNYLMSTFAPDYSKSLKMRGNIAYLTVGDYLYRQPGIFTDIKLSGILDSHWETVIDKPENGESSNHYEVPKHIKVGLSFKPIHTFLPRKTNSTNTINAPFITPDKIAYPTIVGNKNKYLD